LAFSGGATRNQFACIEFNLDSEDRAVLHSACAQRHATLEESLLHRIARKQKRRSEVLSRNLASPAAPRLTPEKVVTRLRHIFMTGRTSTMPPVSKIGQPRENSTIDVTLPGMAHAALLQSTVTSGRIRHIAVDAEDGPRRH